MNVPLGSFNQNQGESSCSRDDEYVEVPSLVKLQGVNLPKAWPRFCLAST